MKIRYIVILLLLLTLPTPVQAHTDPGQVRLQDALIDKYRLNVWTYPIEMHTGLVEVQIEVRDAASNVPCLQCQLQVSLQAVDGETVYQQPATPQGMLMPSDVIYEARFTVEQAGTYAATIELANFEGALGEVGFEMDIPDQTEGEMWVERITNAALLAAIGLFMRESVLAVREARQKKNELRTTN